MGPCGDAPGYFLWAQEPTSCFVKFDEDIHGDMEHIFIGDIYWRYPTVDHI